MVFFAALLFTFSYYSNNDSTSNTSQAYNICNHGTNSSAYISISGNENNDNEIEREQSNGIELNDLSQNTKK